MKMLGSIKIGVYTYMTNWQLMKDKLCIGIANMSKQHGNIPREKLTKIGLECVIKGNNTFNTMITHSSPLRMTKW